MRGQGEDSPLTPRGSPPVPSIEQLVALRDRLAKATGWDTSLDCALSLAFTGAELPSLLYTGSIDAAVTLRPDDWRLRNMQDADPSQKYMPASADLVPLKWDDEPWAILQRAGRNLYATHPTSLPIAICICRIEYEIAKAREPASRGEAEGT